MALQPWQKGIVVGIEQRAAATKSFFIALPETSNFEFTPGQFVTLDLPIHEKPNKRWRSYSIASEPNGTNIIELVIVHLEGGAGTTYLFNEMKQGSELVLRGPQGVFTLGESINNNLFFVCTGTGIAPFRSMIKNMHKHNLEHKEVHLLFGTRTKADLLYYDEMKELMQNMPNFFYHPCLSREQWDGHTGYVHGVYEEYVQQHKQQNNGSLPEVNFFLCGWKNMIDECKAKLIELGYDKKSIHFELYG
jgi:glycine betaine catabolism B